jgi:hypothetical protein
MMRRYWNVIRWPNRCPGWMIRRLGNALAQFSLA